MRARLLALRPRYLRLVVLWSAVQPEASRPTDWSAPGFAGHSLLEDLRALRAARRAAGGFDPVVTFLSMPRWAARAPGGCEPRNANPDARAIDPAALPAYRRMIASLLVLSRREGVPISYWSPWNEPNSGLFLSPQRASCAPGAPSIGAEQYVPLARAMKAEFDAAPGDQRIMVGETSSPFAAHPNISTLREFVDGLPTDVLCGAAVYAQHEYAGDADSLGELETLLRARCGGRPPRIWITETGVGGTPPGAPRPIAPAAERAACLSLWALLDRFDSDPLVDAAFQYSFRDDPSFPVGLAASDLSRVYPAYSVWLAAAHAGAAAADCKRS